MLKKVLLGAIISSSLLYGKNDLENFGKVLAEGLIGKEETESIEKVAKSKKNPLKALVEGEDSPITGLISQDKNKNPLKGLLGKEDEKKKEKKSEEKNEKNPLASLLSGDKNPLSGLFGGKDN